MRQPARPPRENRTITVDFRDEATYFRLFDDGKAFLEWVMAFSCNTRQPVAVEGV